MRGSLAGVAFAFAVARGADAAALPEGLSPQAPFPPIVAATSHQEAIAPGVGFARYYLATADGPLVITAISIDPHGPGLHLDVVDASDRLVSAGETVRSMGERTGALAGINGDFFDISNTNAPVGVVVSGGSLLRSPSGRAAIAISRSGEAVLGPVRFTGDVRSGSAAWRLTGVDTFPPAGGASLLLPAFGGSAGAPGVQIVTLSPVPGSPQTYRVAAVGEPGAGPVPGTTALAFGPAARTDAGSPAVGSEITVSYALDPPLSSLTAAVGGGPLLIRDGAPYADPDSPSPGEAAFRAPLSGALRQSDGTIVLVQVDGRDPAVSIGLNRAEFGSLLRAFGAVDGMALDGGGSSTIVARLPGDALATLQNRPSDGRERPVADGLFVYSEASVGPAARLVTQPASIVALPGAVVPVRTALVDRAGSLVRPLDGSFIVRSPLADAGDGAVRVRSESGSGTLTISQAGFTTGLPIRVVAQPAAVRISPRSPNPSPGGCIDVTADARLASGEPVASAGLVRYSATNADVSPQGRVCVGSTDARVTARIGSVEATAVVAVGHSDVALDVFHDAALWTFTTAPPQRAGSVAIAGDVLRIAAYARTQLQIGGEPRALSFTIDGDGGGAGLRAQFLNGDGQRMLVTLARKIDWQGIQHRSITLPANATAPLTLQALYVVGTLGDSPVRSSGTIGISDLHVTIAGMTIPAPAYHAAFPRTEKSSP
jgi:hypothetical protein